MNYGANIKAARKAAGLTQKQLAERLGISFVNISQLENNQRTPNMATLQRIADALGIHIFKLTGIDEQLRRYGDIQYRFVLPSGEAVPMDKISPKLKEVLSRGPEALYDVLADDNKVEFLEMLKEAPYSQLNGLFDRLNSEGQEMAMQFMRELARIPEYQREQPSSLPQSPPPVPEGTDTTSPPDAPEAPPEGE